MTFYEGTLFLCIKFGTKLIYFNDVTIVYAAVFFR